jgi:L-seryl-tRNA(Ser) seleniumtransferase
MTAANPYRDLPRVDDLAHEFSGALPQLLLLDVIRIALESARDGIGEGQVPDVRQEVTRVVRQLGRRAGVAVINATGVLLHTNLGRARWSKAAVAAAGAAAGNATNVELDVETGERSRRGSYVAELLRRLTGAESALIVNNNAAGLILALAATSSGKAVPVARGELIEIGGSYRLPDVMAVSGCNLVEVGTTNRSRIGDFETAAQIHQIGAFLKIHPSNYRIEGFTEQASVAELAVLAHSNDVPLIYDIGSGLLDAETPWLDGGAPKWSSEEPAARQAIEAGADLVTFSGDKLLGGPQAGIIVGTQDAVATLRAHPLTRALRVDAVTLAGLIATLTSYTDHDVSGVPFWAQAALSLEAIEARAKAVSGSLDAAVATGQSTFGAGSVPGVTLPTALVVLEGRDDLFECLLAADTPILTRRENGNLVMDLRTVDIEDDDKLIDTVLKCR